MEKTVFGSWWIWIIEFLYFITNMYRQVLVEYSTNYTMYECLYILIIYIVIIYRAGKLN